MLRAKDLREYVIRPILTKLNMWSESAEELLLGTSAVETDLGYFLHQIGGPARGIYQMEPNTERDIWDVYITRKPQINQVLTSLGYPYMPDEDDMVWNLAYATAMTRIHYWRIPEPLPDSEDIQGLAKYHKKWYNTAAGKTKPEEFVSKYERFVL